MIGRAPALRIVRRRLAAEQRGAAVTEFALVVPVFLLLLMGLFDLAHMVYIRSILNGAVERVVRNSSLEGADIAATDLFVETAVKEVVPNATFNPRAERRKSYYDFVDVGRAEKWTDTDGNGTCNGGEPFVDENRSGRWEPDVGKSDNGGSGDVVLYTVVVTYRPIFPSFMNFGGTRNITAVGVRKNQPYAAQNGYGSASGSCT